jgi:hypothetical protein
MEHQSSSYRVYSSQSIAPVALRASCPPPKKGVGWAGILFVVLLGAGLSGATLGAQRFLDRATHQPIVAAQNDLAPPPPAASIADPVPAPSPSQLVTAPATSSTTVAAAKPKHRHHRVRPSASATASTTAPAEAVEAPPPNPYEDTAPPDLRFIDRGSRSRP